MEHRMKVSKTNTGKKLSDITKEKIRQFNLGKKLSETTKQKLRETHLKLGTRPPSPLGRKASQETRDKISKLMKGVPRKNAQGKNHYNWRGGLTEANMAIRQSLEYRLWREAVFKRDNYACISCGDNRGGNLVADHIKPFCMFPELRTSLDNGRTLCKPCDKKLGWKGSHIKSRMLLKDNMLNPCLS